MLTRARAGDRAAFAGLYNEHQGEVMRYVLRRVGDQHLAEDLTSETFLRALRRLDAFAWQGKDIGAWLMTIARNIVADHFRSARFRYETSVADMFEGDERVMSAEDTALTEIAVDELRTTIQSALVDLPLSQRTVLTRRYLQEQSIREAAASMELTQGAVKTMTWRAMRNVEHKLAPMREAA